MNIINVKRVVVTKSGHTFDSPGAFRRHEYQKSIGKEQTDVKIRRAPPPKPKDTPTLP